MLTRSLSIAVAGLALTGLVLSFDYATYAATGDSLVLGHLNKAGKPTTLKNTGNGPALKLATKTSAPPFAVTSTKKVAKLNADKLDGWDAAKLSNDTHVFTDNDILTDLGNSEMYTFPKVPKGTYVVALSGTLRPSVGSADVPNVARCWVVGGPTSLYAADSAPYFGGSGSLVSGADTIKVVHPTDFFVQCEVASGTFFYGSPLRLSLTKTNLVQTGALQSS